MSPAARLAFFFVALLQASASAEELPLVVERVRQGTLLVEAETREERHTGSGFFLERRGVVATALHTVAGARRIRVSLPGRFAASDARLIAASASWDVALLEVAWPEEVVYPGLALEGGAMLPAGTEVAVTGFGVPSAGTGRISLTFRGIVSGEVRNSDGGLYILGLDAARGLSGSPVYRTGTGLVAGLLTSIVADGAARGPGCAVPAAVISRILMASGGRAAGSVLDDKP